MFRVSGYIMPITTELELRQFLSSKNVPCEVIEVLPGGSANFCWRIKTLLGNRSIAKHAEPFVRMIPDFPLPVERMDYEHLALTTVPGLISADEHVRLPQIFNYFPDEHVICMSDDGLLNLKDNYQKNDVIDIPLLGRRLGSWLARLHKLTSEPEALVFIEEHFDNTVAKSIFQYPYNGFISVLKQQGHDLALGERIKAKFGSEDTIDRVCLCHGDFWLTNIQLEDQDVSVTGDGEDDTKRRAPVLTIIDWENVRVGNGATDAGRFAADSWLLDRFHGGKGLFEAFMTAYLAERPLNPYDKIRLAVHFAVHIIFYSRMRWTDDKGTKELVEVGRTMLEAVDADDQEKLAKGPLGQLFGM
jgi:hypothetical protein